MFVRVEARSRAGEQIQGAAVNPGGTPTGVDNIEPASPTSSLKPRPGFSGAITLVTGGLTAILGLTVLAGWHLGNARLIQVYPGFTAMAYNTALSFLMLGGAL